MVFVLTPNGVDRQKLISHQLMSSVSCC